MVANQQSGVAHAVSVQCGNVSHAEDEAALAEHGHCKGKRAMMDTECGRMRLAMSAACQSALLHATTASLHRNSL